MSGTRLLLPLSKECVTEIMQQVAARGQPDRITNHSGRLAVDLHGVIVIDQPDKMMKAN